MEIYGMEKQWNIEMMEISNGKKIKEKEYHYNGQLEFEGEYLNGEKME